MIGEFGRPVDALFDPTAYTHTDAQDLVSARTRYGGLVVVSSSSVYADLHGRSLDEAAETGFPDFGGPIGEDTPTVEPGPRTYSTRKVAMERVLAASGVPATVLRPCAIYGEQATHPREWWFIKRGLDGRPVIPVAYAAKSVFHTSSARGVAALAGLCMDAPAWRVLNVADPTPLSVAGIASTIAEATGLQLGLEPFDGPPVGPDRVGGTPWSTERPFVVDTTRAERLGWDNVYDYSKCVGEVCRWARKVADENDWRKCFTGFAEYRADPFNYDAEDDFLRQRTSS